MPARQPLAIAIATAALLAGLATPTLATDTVTVQAQVSIDAPCLTVSTTSIDFGRSLFSTDVLLGLRSQPFTYASCSGTAERVYARATDASGSSASWSLVPGIGDCSLGSLNEFSLLARGDVSGEQRIPQTWGLLTVDSEIETLVADAAGSATELEVTLPCQGSDGAGETMSFQITFTASF